MFIVEEVASHGNVDAVGIIFLRTDVGHNSCVGDEFVFGDIGGCNEFDGVGALSCLSW